MNKKNTMTQRTPEKSKLERDLEGKPKITLKELKETAVNTLTQEIYNTLMQVYECGGWKWYGGDLPTQDNYWTYYKGKTCIRVKNEFSYEDEKYYRKTIGYKIISTKRFYKIQNITPDMLGEINKWFKEHSR